MAITRTQKQPRGYEVQKTRYREFSDGIAPPIEAYPAYYLPVWQEDKVHDLWFVIEAGRFVALDATSINSGTYNNESELVPANGNNAEAIVYTANDIGVVLDADQLNSGSETLVTAAGTASLTIAANFPCGIAPYNYYTKASEKSHYNVFPQPNVTFLTHGMYEIGLHLRPADGATGVAAGDDQDTIATGSLIKPGDLGWPVHYDPASDSLDQLCGRCVQLKTIAIEDALDKVHTVPGLSLPGTGTSGRQLHEDYFVLGSTSTYVASKARINLLLS